MSGENGTAQHRRCYQVIEAGRWQDFLEGGNCQHLTERPEEWIYRADSLAGPRCPRCGHEGGDHGLATHLEKAFEMYDVKDADKSRRENEMIREFQRKASLYISNEPDKDDVLEWIALMRHHGAPTRLMDWTYSFYVALYLALAKNQSGIVWALRREGVKDSRKVIRGIETNGSLHAFEDLKARLSRQADILGLRDLGDKITDLAIVTCLMQHPLPIVYAVNPFRLNRRLTVQQGLFLLVGDITRPFLENLIAAYGGVQRLTESLYRIELRPCTKERNEILKRLKDMNITNESLFPDLDGFAQSLMQSLAYPGR
jgi:hypothetical protein